MSEASIGPAQPAPAERERAPGLPFPLAFLTSPATMIAMALLAVSLFATPFYLRTTEQQIFEGELLLSLCGGFSRPADPRQTRPPLL